MKPLVRVLVLAAVLLALGLAPAAAAPAPSGTCYYSCNGDIYVDFVPFFECCYGNQLFCPNGASSVGLEWTDPWGPITMC